VSERKPSISGLLMEKSSILRKEGSANLFELRGEERPESEDDEADMDEDENEDEDMEVGEDDDSEDSEESEPEYYDSGLEEIMAIVAERNRREEAGELNPDEYEDEDEDVERGKDVGPYVMEGLRQ
jgi:hypothetical protein